MLRRDGFIRTDGTNGTIVTFDVNNPAHVAKVPLEWPQPDAADTAPYEIVMRLHGNTLCAGLTRISAILDRGVDISCALKCGDQTADGVCETVQAGDSHEYREVNGGFH